MRSLSQAQRLVLQDLQRMSRGRGYVPADECRHFDGRTLRGLERRGLAQYRNLRYYV